MSSLLDFLFILGILLTTAAGRSLPKGEDNADKKQPEWLIDHHQGTVLIPGAGRFMLPPLHGHSHSHGHGLKDYNPITGTYGPGGSGGSSGSGAGVGSPHGYVPGGDDTFVPNPGIEVPIPGSGSGAPVTGRP